MHDKMFILITFYEFGDVNTSDMKCHSEYTVVLGTYALSMLSHIGLQITIIGTNRYIATFYVLKITLKVLWTVFLRVLICLQSGFRTQGSCSPV